METHAPKAVFISYASQDAKAARRIADALRGFGVEVWFDQSELRGGDVWDQKIRKQIKECALFLPVISATTQERGEGYFRLEWKLAVERTHLMAEGMPFIVPVTVDDIAQTSATVPEQFLRVQWTRLLGGMPTPRFVEQMRTLVEMPRQPLVAGAASVGAGIPAPASPLSAVRQPFRRAGWLVGAAVITATVVILAMRPNAGDSPGPSRLPPNPKSTAVAPIDGGKSIAVLPFVSLSQDKGDEYLSDGMTEELLNVLAKVPGLRVPGRSSSFAFKGKNEEGIFRKVGAQLHVDTVLEGSVRKAGTRLRITVQLINVADGYHLWSETYDGDMNDILSVQSDVARRVVQTLQVKLGVEATRALASRPTENLAAYEHYLKGRFYLYQYTGPTSKQAIDLLNQAIALDPGFAKAHAGLAVAYAWVSSMYMPPSEAMPLAKRSVEQALRLDDTLAEAHHSYATIKWWGDWDFPGAEQEFKRSLDLNPNETRVHYDYAFFLAQQSRFDEAVNAANKAAQLSPGDGTECLTWIHLASRRYEQAVAFGKQAVVHTPSSSRAHETLAWVYVEQAKFDAAITESRKALELAGEREWYLLSFAIVLARSGKTDEARQYLAELSQLPKEKYLSPVYLAVLHQALGEHERAMAWLQRAYEGRCDHLLEMKVQPAFDPMRADPRFTELLKNVGLEK